MKGVKRSHEEVSEGHQAATGSSAAPDTSTSANDASTSQATASAPPVAPKRIKLAECTLDIVGTYYYSGRHSVTSGEKLDLIREPQNRYDSNAIRVALTNGTTLGHMPKEWAADLAPLMDQDVFVARAHCSAFTYRPDRYFKMVLRLFGMPDQGDDPRLRDFGRQTPALAPAPTPYVPQPFGAPATYAPPAPRYPPVGGLSDLTARNQALENTRADTLGTLFTDFDPATLPLAPQPKLKTKLLPHQLQALAWMTKQEHPKLPVDDKPVQLWQKRKTGSYFNVASREMSVDPPVLARGGILADDMGLGKTLSSIALIASNPDGSDCLDAKDVEAVADGFVKTTLVVCPLSVLSNWKTQIAAHTGEDGLSFHIYHGDGRDISLDSLKEYDIIVTTYQTISNEWIDPDPPKSKKKKKTQARALSKDDSKQGKLHRIDWRRVVLDEGHTIRNVKTQMARACHGLRAERRWSLTGTPLINSSKDAGAALTFLGLCAPLNEPAQWTSLVERRFKKGTGPVLLKAVVTATTLRRTKDMTDSDGKPIVKLPALKFFRHTVTLDDDAREQYEMIEKNIQLAVRRTMREEGDLVRPYSEYLIYLLRLRQMSCDASLLPGGFLEEVKRGIELQNEQHEGEDVMKLEERIKLQRLLLELQYEDCSICFSTPEEPVITRCSHAYCNACICQVINHALGQNSPCNCPMCRRGISKDMLVPLPAEPLPPVEADPMQEDPPEVPAVDKVMSAKSRELVRLLKGAAKENARSLVFSQWTAHLDLIGDALADAGIDYCRFDGSMSAQKREKTINDFQSGQGPDVMVLVRIEHVIKLDCPNCAQSLHAGALGLNLTAASCVFLMDPWWQSSIEQQAIDRSHRLGQVNDVRVFQLIAENTVEERVLNIQKRKEKIISDAFSGIRAATRSQASIATRMSDMLEAFGMKDEIQQVGQAAQGVGAAGPAAGNAVVTATA